MHSYKLLSVHLSKMHCLHTNTKIFHRLNTTGSGHVDGGNYYELVLKVSKGRKKKGTRKLLLNMTDQFGLTTNAKPFRVQQFSFIGAAMLLVQLDPPKIKPVSMTTATVDFNRDQLRALTRAKDESCLLYTSPSPRDRQKSRMPSSA